jgi:hypothetical protein
MSSNYIPNPGYPGIATQSPASLQTTAGASFARLTSTSTPAFKALIYNAGSVDVYLSMDGSNSDRTIPAGTEYEWSTPDGTIPADLSDFWVKAASGTAGIKVLYR